MKPYPFTAVVGLPDLRLALVLSSISPAVGGVLVRGEKGTAKSTMVRALAGLLPGVDVVDGCRFSCDPAAPDPLCPDGPHDGANSHRRPAKLVELPVGAAEDRVIGSLHLERALAEGVTDFQPGLLAAAHRGLLYVDEVNLLHDHLVDTLLDAAAMGRATVEREGVSVSHAARFVLIGTMNPEEGELRPQLLDRFGLTVEVASSRDPEQRVEVVRRRLAYEADPDAFAAQYAGEDARLAADIEAAQRLLPAVKLPDEALRRIAEVCASFEVDGMRADIVTARAAVAHAAWAGRDEVTTEDVRVAARLALPHRRRRNPFDAPGISEEQLEQALQDAEPDPGPEDDGPGSGSAPSQDEAPQGKAPQGEPKQQNGGQQKTVGAGDTFKARVFRVKGMGEGERGRRSRAITDSGRTIGVQPASVREGRPHLVATVKAAAPHQKARGRTGAGLELRPEDLRFALREGREGNLVLFCVDASGSMGAKARMREVKSAVLSLLLDAYQRRDKVGLVTFRGDAAELALPPTISVDAAASRLEGLPTGGRTPLAEGLLEAARVLRVEEIRDPRRRPLLVVVTDGRATSGPDAVARAKAAAGLLAGVTTILMDCESGKMRLGLAADLAAHLGAEHVPLADVAAESLADAVRARTGRAA
ncbi:magnesium chelatase subunit ChlD [Amycolatopsis mediterranei S699]|uniref:Mg-protoporphyrin IX chelatase n=3 Tax=Amycolatopsis mediterranei TaxID=33910 RepID=A0A0H3DEZ0_AMYMU|nr:putative cobaltochelatase [Amycolatopsis mediterranei]ADJ48772.1 magnesium chelatase subunit ChlD [Amycolatopsis mediterranei U32]AEK45712.1 magnesium chelatase subunit ChlD [Amycolatopsis mediterranei S699]AFO80481.1 magnesium chelatase subunit ChlD [Amycolatopsis mediterranei S699]AGT87609.1 magnesium chelatase subunit ChlD [Amycolatopsis mediterranei RB]KDO03989.1 magnesium chelatase [Amycolatopsis mediterranei]